MKRQVFLSYARDDRETVVRLEKALERTGYQALWDRELGGGLEWTRELERHLVNADCIVVVWSKDSVASDWVLQEARAACERGVCVPIMIDSTPPPSPFETIHAIDFMRWNGDPGAAEFELLVDAIQNFVLMHEGWDTIRAAIRKMEQSFEGVDLNALTRAAQGGAADAQWLLGEGLVHGLGGLAKDPGLGCQWLAAAAQNGHLDATWSLGMYHFLWFEESTAATALPWFERAAELGHGYSAWMAAEIHGHGMGDVRKNLVLGRQYQQRAAELGYR